MDRISIGSQVIHVRSRRGERVMDPIRLIVDSKSRRLDLLLHSPPAAAGPGSNEALKTSPFSEVSHSPSQELILLAFPQTRLVLRRSSEARGACVSFFWEELRYARHWGGGRVILIQRCITPLKRFTQVVQKRFPFPSGIIWNVYAFFSLVSLGVIYVMVANDGRRGIQGMCSLRGAVKVTRRECSTTYQGCRRQV